MTRGSYCQKGVCFLIKSTFYNLPDAKRERVIRAIMAEFAGNDSDKVSINRIIERADISRGSFYQYFDDKVDLAEVVLKSLVDLSLEELFRAVSVSNGDIFYVYTKAFDVIAGFRQDEEQCALMTNLVRNMRVSDSLISTYISTRCRGFEELKKLNTSFSREKLRMESDEDMLTLQQLLNAVLQGAVYRVYGKEEDAEAVRAGFIKKIDIIRRGAEK